MSDAAVYHTKPIFTCTSVFFFNDTPTTEIYTLSLHDALPIYLRVRHEGLERLAAVVGDADHRGDVVDRSEGTRLNSSHSQISYAVFCLKKKKNTQKTLLT